MLGYICATKCLRNMAKRLLFLFLMAASVTMCKAADGEQDEYQGSFNPLQIEMSVSIINPSGTHKGSSYAPIRRPTIGMLGNTLYLYGQFQGLTLQLLDGGAEVYSTVVEPNVDEVELPCGMPGTYELRLCDGRFIYSCKIELTE